MDEVKVSTIVHVPPKDVYDFLMDFEGYAKYSDYVNRVVSDGDGSVGTRYKIEFGWWKITYASVSRVHNMVENEQIEWEIQKDIDAHGGWYLEEVDVDEYDDIPDTVERATRVMVEAKFNLDSTGPDAIDIPRLVSFDWVVNKVKPKILEEASKVIHSVIEDVEGKSRSVDLTIHKTPDSLNVSEEELQVTKRG